MTRMTLSKILEPVTIGKLEIPNRVVSVAHGTHLAHEVLDEDSIAYHAERALGGCGADAPT